MKNYKSVTGIAVFLAVSLSVQAQEKSLVMNGSFETISRDVHSTGDFVIADSISSSNNTSVDLYSKTACGRDYGVPANYMGTQESKTGSNYAGIIAFYADDAGLFSTKPGYRKYSEYVQLAFHEPLLAGKAYTVSFNASLAEKSAYAVSGLGVYFSNDKMDVKNNAFLNVTPHVVSWSILAAREWTVVTGTYVASGGERYLTLGCFDQFMDTVKVAAPNTNNSRKAYYYIDDVGLTPVTEAKEDITMVLSGACYQLDNLHFETDKAIILPASFDEMKSLSLFLKTYPYIVVYIDGHTDKMGTEKHNDNLSQARAAAVKNYLVDDGIRSARLQARSYGESQPLDKKNDNSLTNRRVEITICAAPVKRID